MSHILHIDKPEDCACAAEKSTLPHQTEVSNGLCSGTILSKQPVFKNYNSLSKRAVGEINYFGSKSGIAILLEIHTTDIPAESLFNQIIIGPISQHVCYTIPSVCRVFHEISRVKFQDFP